MMDHGTAAVVALLRSCDWRALQVPAQIFYAAPSTAGPFDEVHFPGAAMLGIQITVPSFFVTDRTEARQTAGFDACIAVVQHVNDGVAPDGVDGLLFKAQ